MKIKHENVHETEFFQFFEYEIAYEEFVYGILENITICLFLGKFSR